MDPRMRAAALVTIMFATVSASPRLGAQDGLPQAPGHYRVIDLGTLGGTFSTGNTINNLGWVMGGSNETGDAVQLATLWLPGQQVPLGTLGGPSSDVLWPVKNDFGLISGVTENGTHDPLNETFSCPVFGLTSGNSCVAFAWRNGAMTQLPGLGGNNSIGAGVNNRGQIVGWAENAVHDPSCTSGGGLVQVLQFEAVVWEMHQGQWKVRQLPAFPGDPDAAATAINDAGQVVGISGLCSVAIGGYSAIHAVLWEDGHPIDLHNLGGPRMEYPGRDQQPRRGGRICQPIERSVRRVARVPPGSLRLDEGRRHAGPAHPARRYHQRSHRRQRCRPGGRRFIRRDGFQRRARLRLPERRDDATEPAHLEGRPGTLLHFIDGRHQRPG